MSIVLCVLPSVLYNAHSWNDEKEAKYMSVVVRFAPSPTGFLHIGGARTALFNWLYARNQGGKFLLRIEDTDRERSTKEAIDAILDGLEWLGLEWDDHEYYQFSRAKRHKEVAESLVKAGKAYYCYASKEELEVMREMATAAKMPFRYDGRWRDRPASDAPKGIKPVIRLKAPTEGETVLEDKVQGRVVVPNKDLDDMVLLRSDGTPTYMLAAVVDDHDMGITHVIRGDDHLTNASRQILLFQAMNWDVPVFAHIPLIHGPDGAKLSKRHGALGVDAYRDMGYLPEAMRNYLLRLGWSHGDDEIINTEQAVKWFNLESIGRSPSRFDFKKLESLNSHYIRECDDQRLMSNIKPILEKHVGKLLSVEALSRISKLMGEFKSRAKTLPELAESLLFLVYDKPLRYQEKAHEILKNDGVLLLKKIIDELERVENFEHDNLEIVFKAYCEKNGLKLGAVMGVLRAAITGSTMSPSMFHLIAVLGKEETFKRLNHTMNDFA
jgi:glutamyl-tRNA synthetase